MSQSLTPGSIISLPARAADLLLKQGNGDAALLYLQLLRHGSAAGLSWPQSRLDDALAVLDRLGMAPARELVLPPDPPAVQEPPTYTTEELSTALEDKSSPFTLVADEVERQLGKKLNVNDLKSLYTLYDHLALPAEVILLLVTWCVEEFSRKYGPGRKPHLSQIRKEGFLWARKGIETVEQAEDYLKRQSLLRSKGGEILRILDLPPRPLVQREQDYVATWTDMGFPNDTLRTAYEKTVMKKGSMDWSYMNGILRRWHEQGLHTPDEVARENRRTGSAAAPSARDISREKESPRAREDMERMRRLMGKLKEEG